MHKIGININQISKKVNSTIDLYPEEIKELKNMVNKIWQISNKICQENGLATSMPTSEKGRCYKEDMEYKRGTS